MVIIIAGLTTIIVAVPLGILFGIPAVVVFVVGFVHKKGQLTACSDQRRHLPGIYLPGT